MIRPDLLITQIAHVDYPLFYKTIKDHRDFFGKIIIYLSFHYREPDLTSFFKEKLKELGNTIVLEPTATDWSTEDWRNHSTNEMINYSDSEWI